MTDFATLLYQWLPGIYRDKDSSAVLRNFVTLMAAPLTEVEGSIGQLYQDFFMESCRAPFLPLIGDLIGAQLATGDPPSLQLAELRQMLQFYRNKGREDQLDQTVSAVSTWTTTLVDFSQVAARAPFVDTLDPLLDQRGIAVTELPPGSGWFYFGAGGAVTPLYDAQRGRPIRRDEIEDPTLALVGSDSGFAILDLGADIVGPRAPAPRPVVGADLTNFAAPLTPAGTALVLAPGQMAVDPALGRFLAAAPTLLAGNLTVSFHQLVPQSVVREIFDLTDPAQIVRLGRSDDPAPYTLDLRSSARPTDRIGRVHFDNQGFYLTLGRPVANQRPNLLVAGAFTGFSFDSRPLASGDTAGNALQLQDGMDGSPLTRAALEGHEAAFVDAVRGFSVRNLKTSLLDPGAPVAVDIRAADLTDFANPKTPAGAALTLAATDVAVDPQLGRFLINLTAVSLPSDQVRVAYLLAPASRISGGTPSALAPAPAVTFTFAADGSVRALRDAYDGTLLSTKLNLGSALTGFHGSDRGWRVKRNGVDLAGALAPERKTLDGINVAADPGMLAIDLDRGRFALPAGFLAPTDVLTVDYSAEDASSSTATFTNVQQRLPRTLPAGVSAVLIDTRKPIVNPRNLT